MSSHSISDNEFDLPQSIKEQTISEVREENAAENALNDSAGTKLVTNAIQSKSTFHYNATAARDYAYRWWDGRNPSYQSMPGDDCTNFASQVVCAGGYATHYPDWYMDQVSNYQFKWSHSWTVVGDFYSYWVSTRGHSHKTFTGHDGIASYADVGDILQLYDQDGSKGWYHTVIITKISGDNVYYAAHSDNHKYKDLDKVNGYDNDFRVIKF
jgi:hypothetical protein